jgi:hypothetical protein
MVAWGLEQNDPRLFKVPRYSSSVIIPHMRPETKTLGYLGAQTSHPKFNIWWHGTHAMIGLGYLGAWIVVIGAWLGGLDSFHGLFEIPVYVW